METTVCSVSYDEGWLMKLGVNISAESVLGEQETKRSFP